MYGHDVDTAQPPDDQTAAEEQRLAAHGLISTRAVMARYHLKTPGSARRLMSDQGIQEVRGYPLAQVEAIERPGRHPAPGPGRGHRKTSHAASDVCPASPNGQHVKSTVPGRDRCQFCGRPM